MNVLARVVFHVDAGNPDPLAFSGHGDVQPAVLAQRLLKLGDLIILGHVGVEIVFAGETGVAVNLRVDGQRHAGGIFHRLAVQRGQHARHAGAYFTDVGVGRVAERVGAGAEQLAFGGEMHMNLKPDDGFIIRHEILRKGGMPAGSAANCGARP